MYTLYTDKSEDFKCQIGVEGTSINETTARLVIENDDVNLLFEGKIDSEGNCVIPIKKLRNLIPEGNTGTIKLEVISEDTFFSPWEDEYVVDVSKKVTVEFVEPKKTIKESPIKVNVTPQVTVKTKKNSKVLEETAKTPTTEKHGVELGIIFKENGITLSNLVESKNKVVELMQEYSKEKNVKLDDNILNGIIDKLGI